MDVFAINTIQETVHLVSMFSYMNTLSEFLFSKSFITEQEKLQLLPIANGIYHYLETFDKTPEKIQQHKVILIKEIIAGSDIYGGKPDEIPDPIFVNELFKRIITSIVFNNETNIFGFIVDTIRNSNTTDVKELIEQMQIRLNSSLPSRVFERVFHDYLLPMFPLPVDYSVNLISAEFVYAQAGAMFVFSGSAHAEFDQIFPSNETGGKFDEYLRLAHAIEHLISAAQMEKSAMKIFSLPALLYYVAKQRENLINETTANIVTNPDHLANGWQLLFDNNGEIIAEVKSAQQMDSRYEFISAMANYENRSEMARNLIIARCLLPEGTSLNDEVEKYKNNPGEYVCTTKNTVKETMPNLNELFHQQNEDILEKYFQYEKDAITEVFGEEFIKSVDNDTVEISKGFYVGYVYGPGIFDVEDVQVLKDSDDLLKFHYVPTGDDVYYGLTRTNITLTLIRAAGNDNFRQQLGLQSEQPFRDRNFVKIKKAGEKFAVLVNRIVKDREEALRQVLDTDDYNATLISRESLADHAKDLVNYKLFENVALTNRTVNRIIDPGCELIFSISKLHLHALRNFINNLETRYPIEFPIVKNFLRKYVNVSNFHFSKWGTMFDRDVFFRTTTYGGSLGYGYKFAAQPDNANPYVQLRSVVELNEEIPILMTRGENNETIYNEVNLITGETKGQHYRLENRFPFERSENAETRIRIESEYNSGACLTARIKGSSVDCHRSRMLYEKLRAQNDAIILAKRVHFTLPNDIRTELNSYIFLDNFDQIAFVSNWITKKMRPSSWENKKLQNPDEFHVLMYNETVDNPNLTEWDANQLIAENYATAKDGKLMIRLIKPVNIVRDEFLQFRVYESMSFLDYYSLVHFMYRGFETINDNSHEAGLMQQALYRLAIRQFGNERKIESEVFFTTVLMRVDDFNNTFHVNRNKPFVLSNFTPTTKELLPAMRRVNNIWSDDRRKVLYKFNMQQSYLSARVNNVLKDNIEENILLPGTQFKIIDVKDKFHHFPGVTGVKFIELSNVDTFLVEPVVKKIMDKLHELEIARKKFNSANNVLV